MKCEKILSCDANGNLKYFNPEWSEKEKIKSSSIESLKNLLFEESIIYVHDDLDPWACMSVGLDENRQLVIMMSYSSRGSSSPDLSYDKLLTISDRGTQKLISRLHTSLTRLPKAFADEFAYYDEGVESWNFREVFDIFNEIQNYLSCLNIRYRIRKDYL